MKSIYQVAWTDEAKDDLTAIIQFISADKKSTAKKLYEKIMAAGQSLKKSPYRGRYLPELKTLKALPFRELIIKPWRLIYRIKEKKVQILGLFDARRDLEEILFERLTRL